MKDTIHVYNLHDLEQFGIIPLTRESCAYNMRTLCDLTEEGKILIQQFLGGTVEFLNGINWNSKGSYSMMLPDGIFQTLVRFIAFKKDYRYVVETSDSVLMTDRDDYVTWAHDHDLRVYVNHAMSCSDRNVHQMTGRIV